ncbi:PAAR domain-containing protein [Sorangium sp. So ce429]
MPPAARLGDNHLCKRHGAGPILPACCPTVLIGDKPAARQEDICDCRYTEDPIKEGEPTVLIGDKPAARKGDPTDGGEIVEGCPTVLIGTPRSAACMVEAASAGAPFVDAGE